MPSLQERLADDGELLNFPDTEPIQALQMIIEQRPGLIVLERLFAATPRGAALINRIKNDPELGHAEVRVMSHTGDYTKVVSKGSGARPPDRQAAVVATSTAPPGERRPRRQRGRWTGTARVARRAIASATAWRFSWTATRRGRRSVAPSARR